MGGASSGGGFGGGKGFGGGGKGFGGYDSYGGDKGFGGGGKSKGKGKGKPAIFVGGLSFDTTTDSLENHFAGAGQITYARVMTDRDTGRSRGTGKIEFADEHGMNNAIAQWNGSELDGRVISVRQFT